LTIVDGPRKARPTTFAETDHTAGVVRGSGAEPCSDEKGSAPVGASTDDVSPQWEKVIVVDHGCPSFEPRAEYRAGSLERAMKSRRAEPVVT